MATEQIAWALNADKQVVLIYPTYQSSPYTGDSFLVDITVSKGGTVLALELNDASTIVHFSKPEFPMVWQEFSVDCGTNVNAGRCDASPSDELYLVLSTGELAKLAIPKKGGGKAVKAKVVAGIDRVSQVSAAPDGQVWVVAFDSVAGSHVQKMDTKGKWQPVEGTNGAVNVTGTAEGGAYIMTSGGEIVLVDAKGEKSIVPTDFTPTAITVGPDNRLWALSAVPQEGGSMVYYTDDDGRNWTVVENSGAVAIDAGLITSEVGVSV